MFMPSFISCLYADQVTVTDLENGKLKPVILIDVRSPEAYAVDRIASSVLVPLEEIQDGTGIDAVQKIVRARFQPDQPEPTIVLYCEICPGAIRAYQRLKKTGLNLAVLNGGITAWRQTIPANRDAEVLAAIAVPAA